MLQKTVENIGRSAMARDSIRVVLAMEAREGVSGQQKANRIIANTSHLFADMMAAYHPEGIAGEIAGKSSNTQWAYRAACQRWGALLERLDASKVLLTVGDADTLWHPQFFSALACEALSLTAEERAWSFWQPPVLLLRNLWSVPGPTRVSGYATILFELAGLANQYFGHHFCYSAYSLSLAMASHPMVSGWDNDVIAEDHHMFCKCYFASLWDGLKAGSARSDQSAEALVSKVLLRPVYLPAISYLVESDEGWVASAYARFQQARRHCQGIAELSYIFLQYARMLRDTGVFGLPARTHASIFGIAAKMGTVHIVNQVQAMAFTMATMLLVPGGVSWVLSGGLAASLQTASTMGYCNAIYEAAGGLGGLFKYVLAIFGPLPPMSILMTVTTSIVVMDVLEGRLTDPPQQQKEKLQLAEPSLKESKSGNSGSGSRLKLFLQIQSDYFSMAHFTLVAYGLLPSIMACWSLMRRGHRFEYIVAAKPA